MSITGRADGEAGAGPMKVGVALTDLLTGLYASTAILAALRPPRPTSGSGQHIDLALLDVQVACLANQGMNYLHGGKVPRRLGNAHPNVVPYQDFPTADGDMILAIGNDGQFARLVRGDRPAGAGPPTRASRPTRRASRTAQVLMPHAAPARRCARTTHDWIAAARSRRRALRADQRHRAGVRRPAGASRAA